MRVYCLATGDERVLTFEDLSPKGMQEEGGWLLTSGSRSNPSAEVPPLREDSLPLLVKRTGSGGVALRVLPPKHS